MRFNKYKLMALGSAIVMQMMVVPSLVEAANNADVTVDIETAAGITAVTQTDMNFGSWLIGIRSGETPTITLDEATGNVAVAGNTNSDIINLTGATTGTRGSILVTLPTGADGLTLQMSRGVITQFVDTSLVLSNIEYLSADNGETGVLASGAPNSVDILVTTGGTGALVRFGGRVTANATPVGDGIVHTASFDVAFAY